MVKKLLLDECVDWRVAENFPDSIEVQTVGGAGWSGTKNGDLLKRAAAAGYDALVTVDKNIENQQNLNTLPVTVLVLDAPTTDLNVLRDMIPKAVSKLSSASARTFIKVRAEAELDESDEHNQSPTFS